MQFQFYICIEVYKLISHWSHRYLLTNKVWSRKIFDFWAYNKVYCWEKKIRFSYTNSLKLTPLIFLNFNYSNFNDEFTNTFDTHAPIKISKLRGNTKLRKQNVTNRNYEKIKGLPVLRLRNYQRKTMETDKIF